MSTANEIFSLLDGEEAEVVARVLEVRDHTTAMALHIAEQHGRGRKKVLAAIEGRGLDLEKELPAQDAQREPTPLEREVARAVAEIDKSRPNRAHVREDLGEGDYYPVPEDEEFIDPVSGKEWDYMEAGDLADIAAELFGNLPEYLHGAHGWNIQYLWKRHGAKSGGKERHGYTRKLGGELRYYAGFDFIVVVSADFTREWNYTTRQMRALLFHELLHIGRSENYAPKTRPHEFEVFGAELEVFGYWQQGMERLNSQISMPGMP